ncbi:MAG: hypothetical protein WEE89_12940, partial [Gemmatimonadota bacterium]
GWPVTIFRAATIILATGFPATLVLAWFHGERGAQRIHAIELVLLGALLVTAGAGVAVLRPEVTQQKNAGSEAANANSIAVLPFADMTSERNMEYFGDGMAEEILHALGRVSALKVAGRTASFSFKNKQSDLHTIGQSLGVAHVLDGSVRSSNGKLRINVQLVRTSDQSQLWSQNFDKHTDDDVFAIQDEIANAIVNALRVQLVGDEAIALRQRATTNPQAYVEFLRGNFHFARRTERDAEQALAAYRRAFAIDPDLQVARARIAMVYLQSLDWGWRVEGKERNERRTAGTALTDSVLKAAPNTGEAWLARAFVLSPPGARRGAVVNIMPARRAVQRAIELDSTNPEAYNRLAAIQMLDGHLDSANVAARRVVTLDPTHAPGWRMLGTLDFMAGKFTEAEARLDTALALAAERESHLMIRARVRMQRGDTTGALLDADSAQSRSVAALVYALAGQPARAREWLEQANLQNEPATIGLIQLAIGQKREALATLRSGVAAQSVDPRDFLYPEFKPLFGEPEFRALAARARRQVSGEQR